jgi:hypothetical protein
MNLRLQTNELTRKFMEAYSSLQELGVVDTLITPSAIAAVRSDISAQFVDRFWWPTDRSEPAVDSDGFAVRSLAAAPVDSDWQIFRTGDGIGNWGLNAHNGRIVSL